MEIIFAGGSHYETSGFNSLKEYFDKIYVLDNHADAIKPLMRKEDVLIDCFEEVSCRYVFLCGYARLITEEELSAKVFTNVHGSLLPKYRGMHPTFYAIMNGEKKLGITFHLVNQYMDAGDILAQFSFDYTGQNVANINSTIDDLVGRHAGKTLYDYISGKLATVPQDESKALFGAKRSIDDCVIDFNMSNTTLRRFFMALTPNYPYPMLSIREEKYEVLPEVDIIDRDYYGPIGRAVFVDEKGVWIKTREGFLVVQKIRKYGEFFEHPARDFIPIGFRFG